MINYLNFLFILYNFIINIYKILFVKSNNNLNFIYITDILGKFYVINLNDNNLLTFDNRIVFKKNSIISHIKEKITKYTYKHNQINYNYSTNYKIYPQTITKSEYHNIEIIKPNFIKFDSYYIPIFYHVIDIHKYNPYGIYIHLLIIKNFKIYQYLLFKPNFDINCHRNKVLASKYYAKDILFKNCNMKILDDIDYIKYFY